MIRHCKYKTLATNSGDTRLYPLSRENLPTGEKKLMTFLTSQPDLSGTIFAEVNLLGAREYLTTSLEQEDRAWLNHPQGPLREYWERDDNDAVCFMINFASTIARVASNITDRSHPLLAAKVKVGLLRAHSEKEFLENYTEFQVASALANYASPLILDPMVAEEDLLVSANRPSTPDFALQLPDGDAFLDATVCHVDVFDQWEKAGELIQRAIEKRLLEQQRTLQVLISLPLQYEYDHKEREALLRAIRASATGTFPIGSNGKIQWQPISFQDGWVPSLGGSGFSFGIYNSSSGGKAKMFSIFEKTIAPVTEEDEEVVLKSIRNTLDHKHRQFPEDMPAVLIIRFENRQLAINDVINRIYKRIWPNDKIYGWITGICLFIPRRGFHNTDDGDFLLFCANPNANVPASDALVSLFEGTAQFHLSKK